MIFFKPPKTAYQNYYDEARFNLTWKLNAYMFLANIPLVIMAYFMSKEEFFSILYGWLVPLVYLIILKLTKKYKVLALIYVLLGTLTTAPSMYFVPGNHHLVQILFMVMLSLYTFIVIGRFAGILTVLFHSFWVAIYIAYGLNRDILNDTLLNDLDIIWNTSNFILAFSMVSYLILEFTRLNKHAEDKYVNSNLELTKTNTLVKLRDQEKTVMLQEIHHRVKNNLQVITSLLRLQSYEVKDEKALQQFEDAINRVVAMSMIHEKMYQTQDFASLNIDDYLKSLAQELITSYSVSKHVNIDIQSSIKGIGNKALVPLSLIFNELISNSLKHAFEQNEKCVISIQINSLDDNRFELNYSDNGKWVTQLREKSFGLELLDTLTEQMNGKLSRTITDDGTNYSITLTNLD